MSAISVDLGEISGPEADARWKPLFARREFDLLEGAIALAQDEYPKLDGDSVRARIELLGHEARGVVPPGGPLADQLLALNHLLGIVHGFRGNTTEYRDPRNSFIHLVLSRKTGIPISLALVWLEVARRANIPLFGIGFPGHYLVGAREGDGQAVLDPFHGGRSCDVDDLRKLLGRTSPGLRLSSALLQPTPPRQTMFRMLGNLRGLYIEQGDHFRALRIFDRLLRVAPDHPGELRGRAALWQQMGQLDRALEDLQRILLTTPEAPDAREVALRIQQLSGRSGWRQ